MDDKERILALEKALLDYVKTYGFNEAAREYFVRGSSQFASEQRQLN
ncbi:hypothetical protein [uncultured Sulfitobacter sp.]|nr:hypothetical protein [uncultured Sulfitobacter sp.]